MRFVYVPTWILDFFGYYIIYMYVGKYKIHNIESYMILWDKLATFFLNQ